MPDNIIFYFIFLSQIILISYYYPKQVLNRMNRVMTKYPPTEYPKLYPESTTAVAKGQRIFRIVNNVILVIGFILIFGYGLLSREYESTQKHAEGLPLFYGMLQFMPFMLVEFSGFKQFKLMRNANIRTTRLASLQRRNLFDFVSPVIFGVAVLMFLGYVLFEFLMGQFESAADNDGIIRVVTLIICNFLFAVIICFNLHGKKLDPHQAHDDRIRQISFTIKSLIVTSIFVSVFFIVTVTLREFNLEYLEIYANGLYFQSIALISIGSLLKIMKIEDINFDVYKADLSATDPAN